MVGCTLESPGKLGRLLMLMPAPEVFAFHWCAMKTRCWDFWHSQVVLSYRHFRSIVWREPIHKPLLDCSFPLVLLSLAQNPRCDVRWSPVTYKLITLEPCDSGYCLTQGGEWSQSRLLAVFWRLRNRNIILCSDWKMKPNSVRIEEILGPWVLVLLFWDSATPTAFSLPEIFLCLWKKLPFGGLLAAIKWFLIKIITDTFKQQSLKVPLIIKLWVHMFTYSS